MLRFCRINSRHFSFHFGFLCFFFNEEENRIRRNNKFCKLIFIISLLCFFQYLFNTSYYCGGRARIKEIFLNRTYHYHQRIQSYNRFMAMNYRFINLAGENELPEYNENTPICRLNVNTLGPIKVNKSALSLTTVEELTQNVSQGGFHAPYHCRSRHRVAILVPYRDRLKNLVIFLYYIHRLLKKQLLQYRIFVIEQYGNEHFNKGSLYNIGYIESQRFGRWHCLIFHDVDLIPQEEKILYTCPRTPTHMSPAVESMAYRLWYYQLFGGVTAMTPKHFLKVNGYSNYYWNWGAEDDDMFIRLQASRIPVIRLNASIGRYATLPHKPSVRNLKRFSALKGAKKRFRHEGLRSLEYKLIKITQEKLFTHILADVNPFNYPVA